MIRDVTIGKPAPKTEKPSVVSRFKNVKEAIRKQKRGPLPQDDIKLEEIPF